jgi:catechol 2,3-dioxygenase-like lactoylglutathione lyase family enzyme
VNLYHLYLRVRDLDRAVEFYRGLFGFDGPTEWQGETFVSRNAAGFSLALTPDPAPPEWPAGLHFGFLLESVDEARAVRERVEAAGWPLHESYDEPGFVVFKVADPDGYLVEVEAGVPGADAADADHFISPEERFRVAMARQ